MTKAEVIHQLYNECKTINFDDTYELIKDVQDDEEKDFIRLVTDFILQQKQKRVILEKRF